MTPSFDFSKVKKATPASRMNKLYFSGDDPRYGNDDASTLSASAQQPEAVQSFGREDQQLRPVDYAARRRKLEQEGNMEKLQQFNAYVNKLNKPAKKSPDPRYASILNRLSQLYQK